MSKRPISSKPLITTTAKHFFPSHLSPGGYIEHADISPLLKCDDDSIPRGSMWETQGALAIECGELSGKTMMIQPQMKDLITAAGFVDVVEHKIKWPLGPWSTDSRLKDIGRWNMHSWETGLEGWTMALLTRYKGVSESRSPDRPTPKMPHVTDMLTESVPQWTYEEVKRWNKDMRKCLLDRRVHAYQDM